MFYNFFKFFILFELRPILSFPFSGYENFEKLLAGAHWLVGVHTIPLEIITSKRRR